MNNFKITGYLMAAPLEVLHATSQEWLGDIEFYKDEIAFFYQLLRQKSQLDSESLKTKEAHDIERHLIHVSVHTVGELQQSIIEHEKFLARILEKPELDEQIYRDQHKMLAAKVNTFRSEFYDLKKKIFQLSKPNACAV